MANQAVEQYLLARGADLSDAAVLAYYTANPTQFVEDCVSVIQTTAQSTATAAYDSLKSGTSFTSAAATAAADPAGSARSGQAGCLSEASLQSQLQLTSVAVGQPVGPIQSNGTWEVFVVTSRTPVPVEQAAASIRLILTQATANQERVSKELLSFAGLSIDIDPQYGTWAGTAVKAPTPPATRYLVAAHGSSITSTTTTTTTTSPVQSPPSSGSAAG